MCVARNALIIIKIRYLTPPKIKGINYVICLIINHLRATQIWSVAVKVLTINDMSIPHPISFA